MARTDNEQGFFGAGQLPPLHKTIQHLLRPGLLEINRELVAFGGRYGSVAEFEVEDAFADGVGGGWAGGAGDEVAVYGDGAGALASRLLALGALPAGVS